MIITLPEKMSQEKVDVLKALGAQIIRTPTEAAFDSPESHIGVAKTLNKNIAHSHILDQYANPSNPLAHYDGTAEELLYQCDGRIDYLIATAGTGGTITGIARKLKEKLPNVKIIGVDPVGSILALPESLNSEISSYKVEGIGYDFIPIVLDRPIIDGWIKSVDQESFDMSRRLIRSEGLLVGGSAGSCMAAAVRYIKEHNIGADKRVVVLLADSVRNYMSKFLNDNWMIDNGFMSEENQTTQQLWWSNNTVAELKLETPYTVTPSVTASQCIEILNKHGYDQLPCVSENNEILGMVTLGNLTSQITSGRIQPNDSITKGLYKQFKQISISTKLSQLSKIFDRDHFALVVSTQKSFSGSAENQVKEKSLIFGIATRIDLLNYIVQNKPNTNGTA
jgi:cystathionine beta-synthase